MLRITLYGGFDSSVVILTHENCQNVEEFETCLNISNSIQSAVNNRGKIIFYIEKNAFREM